MNVAELFRRLSFAELSNLSLGSEGEGTIQVSKQSNLIHYTNEALLRLFSRFLLRESDILLVCAEHVTNYQFLKRFAVTSPAVTPDVRRYIVDLPEKPFEEDLLKVMAVYDRYSCAYPLNDSENVFSLFTPTPNTLQVPRPVENEPLAVVYQARHTILPYDTLETEIDLPVVLEGALTAHIAHQVFSFMNGQENQAKANDYLLKYERICADITDKDLVNSSTAQTNSKFDQRGFI